MPGDNQKPIDRKITVFCGDVQAEGVLAGLSIGQTREFIAKNAAEFVIPPGFVARVTTMEPDHVSWISIVCEAEVILLMMRTDRGMELLQGYCKIVPETYVLRPVDVGLSFEEPKT